MEPSTIPIGLRRKLAIKYALDRSIALLLLLILWPIFLLVALLIKLDGLLRPENAGPVFYKESRISEGRTFRIIKFRTVSMAVIRWIREQPEERTISEHPDRTWAGNIILRWYLDELPQLINIAKGEMSFVGPRPRLHTTYKRFCRQGTPSHAILRGGVLGVRQACKTIHSHEEQFTKMSERCQMEQDDWDSLDVLYFSKVRDESMWGMFFFDLSLIVKGLRTVLAGAKL